MSGHDHTRTLELSLVGIAAGQSDAFEVLYQETHAGVYAFALSILKNAHDAQDILHDTFLKVYDTAPTYTPMGKPMAWILTITRNLCYSHLREKQKTAEITPEEWDLHIEPREDLNREERIVLSEGLKTLSDQERQIVLLHAVSDLKHRQIAELLSLPLSTVLSKYRRAIKKLEQLLGKETDQ